MLNLATVTRMPDDGNSMLVLQGTSNVLQAMITDGYEGSITGLKAKEIVEKSNNVVQTLMKVNYSFAWQ